MRSWYDRDPSSEPRSLILKLDSYPEILPQGDLHRCQFRDHGRRISGWPVEDRTKGGGLMAASMASCRERKLCFPLSLPYVTIVNEPKICGTRRLSRKSEY